MTTNLVASVREGNRAESYTYDACGNVETMVERSADGSERKIRYYYDALNQLVREDIRSRIRQSVTPMMWVEIWSEETSTVISKIQ